MTDGHAEGTPNEWDPDDYDGGHGFVYEYGADVVELLAPEPGERILDLGCGTGHLTAEIAASVGDEGRVIGVDRSGEMVARAREAYPDLQFLRADARAFAADTPFDAVFSNAALHWIPQQAAVAETVAGLLRPGGRFVAELGGAGNVATIVDAVEAACGDRGLRTENPWYFPTVGEHATLLERHGFEVTHARLFDRPTDLDGGEAGLREWLGMFGDSLLAPLSPEQQAAVVTDVEERLRPTLYDPESSTWTADYRRLRFVARLDR
ncbi:MAG: trans-aconitate 2-methyltransferase [Haloarculaceae archaeon]